MRRKRTAPIALCALVLIAGLAGTSVLWLRAQQRQHALNRQLIASLVQGDGKQALILVNSGADPNAHYRPTPSPSPLELISRFVHRSHPPLNASSTAFAIACGALWDHERSTYEAQGSVPDNALLIQTMLTHGALVNARDEDGSTPLMWAVYNYRPNTIRLLIEHGAEVNAQNKDGFTPIAYAREQHQYEVVTLLKQAGAK